jgi:hypothetical protein
MGKDGDKQPKPEEVAAAISDSLDSWIPAEGTSKPVTAHPHPRNRTAEPPKPPAARHEP